MLQIVPSAGWGLTIDGKEKTTTSKNNKTPHHSLLLASKNDAFKFLFIYFF